MCSGRNMGMTEAVVTSGPTGRILQFYNFKLQYTCCQNMLPTHVCTVQANVHKQELLVMEYSMMIFKMTDS